MKTAFFEVEGWEIPYIEKSLKKHKLLFFKEPLARKHMHKVKDCDAIAVFIYSKITKEVIESMPKLKLITTMSTGFDHIDTAECRKRKITVCNVPTYGENTVAEHTFGLILTITRKMHEALEKTRKGNFSPKGLRGFDLKDKTIGIVGCGHIGRHVARIAKGFEMDVIVFDTKKDSKLAKKLGFRYASFENLLKNSDIITLHAPYSKATHHMINRDSLKNVKKGAVLINTARGGLVDTGAMITALNKSILGAAGLDVLEGEAFIKEEKQLLYDNFSKVSDLKSVLRDNILMKMPNVYITPHSAFNSTEAIYRILDTTIGNIRGFDSKKKINTVK